MLSQPAYPDPGRVLAAWLAQVPAGAGIGPAEEIAVAVAAGESATVPAGAPIPAHLAARVLLDGDRAAGPAMFLEVTLVVLLGPVKRRRRGDLRDDLPPYRLLLGVA